MTRNPHTPSIGERVRAAMHPEAAEAAFDPTACRAAGCPCRGCIALGGSTHSLCSWHAWAPPEQHGTITAGLRREQDLLDLIGELQAMHREGAKGEPWVIRARQAWAGDAYLQPTPTEARHWNLYLWRMREEVAFRVGLRPDQPAPRVRHCDDPRFAGMVKAAAVEEVA